LRCRFEAPSPQPSPNRKPARRIISPPITAVPTPNQTIVACSMMVAPVGTQPRHPQGRQSSRASGEPHRPTLDALLYRSILVERLDRAKSSAGGPQRRACSDGAHACHAAHRRDGPRSALRWSGRSRQQPARRVRGHQLGCSLLACFAARSRRFTRHVLNGSAGLLGLVSFRREFHRSGSLGQPCEVQGEPQELAARVIIPLALGKRAKLYSPLR